VSFVVTLADAAGAGTVGGKAASLGELARAGVSVPPGFAVTTEAFTAAMEVIDADGALRAGIEGLPAGDVAEIALVAGRFRGIVAAAPLPSEVAAAIEAGYAALGGTPNVGGVGGVGGAAGVAVRSSATVEDSADASFAGLQDTYLGVSGAASVLEHVRRCLASMYNDESVAYRRRLGLPEAGVAMAVVVQRMVAPRAAGVMFTRSPVTGDRSVVAIEGTWGLGSALVSGDVTPDSWVISKITGEITARRVSPKVKMHGYLPGGGAASPSPSPESPADPDERAGVMGRVTVLDTPADLREAPCLTDEEIRALAAVARRVEAHYGAPQDIEWAVLDAPFADAPAPDAPAQDAPADSPVPDAPAESRVVLLQSRPETVWAARDAKPAGAPKARAADHVLALFGKPL
jgi:pyruvate,water dikinase